MSHLDNVKTKKSESEMEDVPDMNARPTLADAMSQTHYETTGSQARVDGLEVEDENEGLPSVNRRRTNNRLVTILGFVFILGAAAALIVAVNSGDTAKPPKKPEAPEKVTNTLPPLKMPAMPEPVIYAPPPPSPISPSGPSTSLNGAASAKPIPVQSGRPNMPAANGKAPPEWYERKMGGTLLADHKNSSGGSQQTVPHSAIGMGSYGTTAGDPQQAMFGRVDSQRSELGTKLEPTITKPVSASLLPDRSFLITKGTTLDCALETALDSTLPGLTTCRLTRDVYSDNGKVLLLDRGSQLVGEYQGDIKQGQARLFVLWSRAKTPNGVVVSLNSPGTDALGRTGLEGWVDTHFAERFGAAILFTLIQDSLQAIIARQSRNGDTVVYSGAVNSGEKVVEKIIDSTVNIPPTLVKNQGDHIQVMVARDLDFASVYGLRVKE